MQTSPKRMVPELSLLSYIHGSKNDQIKFSNELFRGLKEYGFIILVDHPILQKTIDDSYKAIHEFFNLPTKEKLKYKSPVEAGQRGYTGFGEEHAKDSKFPDLKEFWHVGREIPNDHPFNEFYPPNIWPTKIQNFKENLYSLFTDLDNSSKIILEALSMALDVNKDYFANLIKDGNSILRPIHYPPIRPEDSPNSIRSAAHEDINLITMLMGATSSGLQLLDRDGTWLDINTKPGQLVVDSGDMLSRITNNIIPATTHRVINPDDSGSTRFSMPFFVHPNPMATLECIPSCLDQGKAKYPPINAHEFLLNRLKEIGLMR